MKALGWSFALLALAFTSPSPATDDAIVTPLQLNEVLQRAVDGGSPSLSAAIADRRGVIWTGVAGWADLATHRPMDEAALFGIGSITKVFVAVVVLQLVEEGKLALTDTPEKILGRSAVQGIANADVATVAELLGHQAGVPSWEVDPRWIRKGRGAELDPTHHWRKTEALDYVRGTLATAPAGKSFAYSNSGYTLLGLMIEKLTGSTAEAEIRRRVLTPLALTDTYLEGFEPGPAARVPHRYQYLTEKFRADAGLAPSFTRVRSDLIDTGASNLSAEWTAGGMISSPRDLVLFARALNDGRLLKPASLVFMKEWSPGFKHMDVGHGVFRIVVGETPLVGHTGGVLGFTAVLWWTENGDTIVAVLSNGSGLHAGKTPPKATTVGLNPELVSLAIRYARQQGAN